MPLTMLLRGTEAFPRIQAALPELNLKNATDPRVSDAYDALGFEPVTIHHMLYMNADDVDATIAYLRDRYSTVTLTVEDVDAVVAKMRRTLEIILSGHSDIWRAGGEFCGQEILEIFQSEMRARRS